MGTLIVLTILIIAVALAIRTIINDKKAGKSSCGGDCGSCGGNCSTHSLVEDYKRQELH